MMIERVINHALSFDANAKFSLKALAGKTLKLILNLESAKPSQEYMLEFTEKGIQFSDAALEASVVVSGPSRAFLNLALNKDPQVAAKLGLSFSGDVHTLAIIQNLFFSLDIDWEEMLSHWTGDILAHHIGNFFRFTQDKKNQILDSTAHSMAEYLKEESLLLPTSGEVNQFMDDVDTTRSDVERLQAKIAHLCAKRADYEHA